MSDYAITVIAIASLLGAVSLLLGIKWSGVGKVKVNLKDQKLEFEKMVKDHNSESDYQGFRPDKEIESLLIYREFCYTVSQVTLGLNSMAVKWLAENGITKRTETERHAYILERVAIIKDEYKRAFSRSRNIWFGKLTLDELLGRTGLNYLTDKVVDFYNSVHKNHNEKDVALEESIKLLEDKTPAVRESLLKELARNNYAETLKSDIMFLSSHLGAINDLVIGNFHDALKKYIEKEEYIRLK